MALRVFGNRILERYRPLIGEFCWHSLTVDATIESVSKAHYDSVLKACEFVDRASSAPLKILEVGCYAHTTGYMLQENLGADVSLYDLSAKALQLGRKLAGRASGTHGPRLIAGDFHALPFDNGSFDFVFITSALHHTWRWKRVLVELLRIVRPGGVLLLENEPCRREACFYLFRANRVDAFTPFERELDRLGLIRTIAEPYPGSRPETLFGMVENQRIPLDQLLATIEKRAGLLEFHFEPMIADLEMGWIDQRKSSRSTLEAVIGDSLRERTQKAREFLNDEVRALGFGLPEASEIREFAHRVASLIARLPEQDSPEYKMGLTRIFGSPVRILARARKRVWPFAFTGNLLRPQLAESSGIAYCYSRQIRRLLAGEGSRMPDLQACRTEEIERFFSQEHWSIETNENGIRSLILKNWRGIIKVPSAGRRSLILIRFYGASDPGGSLRVRIRLRDSELDSWVIYGGESFLFSRVISGGAVPAGLALEVVRERIGGKNGGRPPGHLSLCLAFAFAV